LASCGSYVFERLWLFRQNILPILFRGICRIDQHDFPVRSGPIGFDQELVANIVDDFILVIADFWNQRRPGLSGLCLVAKKDGITLLALAAIRDIEDGEAFIFRGTHLVKALRIGFVLINEFVLALAGADGVVIDLV